MDIVFFDLDGTLLNKDSVISEFTRETLGLLTEKNIAHTVATGRSMLSAQHVIDGHNFALPHIYNNGVTVWDPIGNALTLENLLDQTEVMTIVECALANGIAPFINTLDSDQNNHNHFIYHGQTRHQVEKNLIDNYYARSKATLLPLDALPVNSQVTNISMIGEVQTIDKMWENLNQYDGIVAYSGTAIEGKEFNWMDVHHRLANKGSAVENLKKQLGASNVICFGDSYNDLSMFALADECYAPDNAKDAIKKVASEVIGHHHTDGVAHFLRERFSL